MSLGREYPAAHTRIDLDRPDHVLSRLASFGEVLETMGDPEAGYLTIVGVPVDDLGRARPGRAHPGLVLAMVGEASFPQEPSLDVDRGHPDVVPGSAHVLFGGNPKKLELPPLLDLAPHILHAYPGVHPLEGKGAQIVLAVSAVVAFSGRPRVVSKPAVRDREARFAVVAEDEDRSLAFLQEKGLLGGAVSKKVLLVDFPRGLGALEPPIRDDVPVTDGAEPFDPSVGGDGVREETPVFRPPGERE